MAAKLSISKKIFDLEKEKILNSGSFKTFLSENEVFNNSNLRHMMLQYL